MVGDPNFWRRFSIAVHQDEAEKETKPSLKHSYVPTPPLASPTSQSHLSPGFPPMSMTSVSPPFSPTSASPPSPGLEPELDEVGDDLPRTQHKPMKRRRSKLQKTSSTKPLLRPSFSAERKTSISQEISERPVSTAQHRYSTTQPQPQEPSPSQEPSSTPQEPLPAHTRTRRPSLPLLSLSRHHTSSPPSLSGRPGSRFKFWTEITADPGTRDSWLESQKRKRRQRTWICWVFWLCFFALVAGVVVTVVLLKNKGII